MDKSTFCLLPFTHISSTNDGNYRVCCCSEEKVIKKADGTAYNMRRDSVDEVWNSDHYKQLRLDLLNGVKNSTCEYCWNYEAGGAYSKRQKTNDEKHDMYPDYDIFINDALENNGALSTPPTDLDLKVGTQCNLKCIMCYPGSSSLQQDEVEEMKASGEDIPALMKTWDQRVIDLKLNMDDFNPKNLDVERLVENLDPSLSKAIHLSLVGGEPLVNKTTTRILEQCVEKDYAKNMMLQIITNLSVINNKTLDQLDKFKHPMLCISYDHIDAKKFNFIRYPASYETFQNNFDKILEYKHIVKKLSTTWGIFNIFDFEEILTHWENISREYKDKFVINFGLIYYPNYFSLRFLELDQKKEITERINSFYDQNKDWKIFTDNPEFVESFISVPGYMGGEDINHESVCKERTRVLELYDRIRGTDYKKLFPHIKEYK